MEFGSVASNVAAIFAGVILAISAAETAFRVGKRRGHVEGARREQLRRIEETETTLNVEALAWAYEILRHYDAIGEQLPLFGEAGWREWGEVRQEAVRRAGSFTEFRRSARRACPVLRGSPVSGGAQRVD